MFSKDAKFLLRLIYLMTMAQISILTATFFYTDYTNTANISWSRFFVPILLPVLFAFIFWLIAKGYKNSKDRPLRSAFYKLSTTILISAIVTELVLIGIFDSLILSVIILILLVISILLVLYSTYRYSIRTQKPWIFRRRY